MQLQLRPLVEDEYGRRFGAAGPETLQALYNHNFNFWSTRFNDALGEAERKQIIADQAAGDTPISARLTQKLGEVIAETPSTERFSMLEIGSANGTALKRIARVCPDLEMTYVGFECLPLLCEDFEKNYPQHTIFVGDVDTFEATDLSAYGPDKFTLFYTSVVFIMIHPDVVRRALKKAARHTDQFLIYDFIEPPAYELQPGEFPVVMVENRSVVWFIHPWESMLDEVGFKIVDRFAADPPRNDPGLRPSDNQYRGIGYIHAVRA